MPAQPSKRRTLVYFGHVPAEGAGSAIIVYRHLRRFQENGWDVRVVADWGQSTECCDRHGWPVLTLSHRRSYWPPFDPDKVLSRRIRTWLWAGEVNDWLKDTKPQAACTYLSAFSDTLSLAATGFAQRYGVPLSTIIHDDARCFAKSEAEGNRAHARRQWILERSHKNWFASPALAATFRLPREKVGLLPPIPEGAVPAPVRPPDQQPLLIYAGSYWNPQIPLLADLGPVVQRAGGRLLAIFRENADAVSDLRKAGVEWRAPFPKNTEALDYFRDHASAMLVSYSRTSEEMPWTRTSFPSKFIEYCHLGLPVAVVATPDTAIAEWARSRNFPDVFAPGDTQGIAAYVAQLKDAAFRRDRVAMVQRFASGEFSPHKIQAQLEADLVNA